ncbi:MAG TPA: fibronectin type III domain-containing protein [Acidobacteriaceae bacterium]
MFAAFLFSGVLLSGCGTTGAPQPPSLKLPAPPLDLTAERAGTTVTLHWTMPRRSTDRVLLTGNQRALVCRALPGQPCTPAANLLQPPGQPATYTDTLPVALAEGAPRLLTYTLLLQNHKGLSAGPSNPAYTAAGAAPPRIAALRVTAEGRGIVLGWQAAVAPTPDGLAASLAPAGAGAQVQRLLRLHRTRILAPGEGPRPGSEETRAGVPQPLEQALELVEPELAGPTPAGTLGTGWPLDHAIDSQAALNRTYSYTVEQVARLTLDRHAVEVSSGPSPAVMVDAKDRFPPAVPQGVEAVADTSAPRSAIDLSWTADADADLAGYIVYRQQGSAGSMARVSPLLPTAGWRDGSVVPGVRYTYRVSAVDTSGNESAPSAPAEETAPRPPR